MLEMIFIVIARLKYIVVLFFFLYCRMQLIDFNQLFVNVVILCNAIQRYILQNNCRNLKY